MAQDEIKNVFVIGGSSGSFEVLLRVLPQLLPMKSAAVIIVLHRKNAYDTALTDVLSHRTAMAVKEAEEKEPLLSGIIYIAPADYHLLIEKDYTFSLDVSERVNYSRPSIDVCFETAAEALGNKLVGILLSGSNMDGSEGLRLIKAFEGITIVQQPQSAESPYMPQQAIKNGLADFILEPDEIGDFMNKIIEK